MSTLVVPCHRVTAAAGGGLGGWSGGGGLAVKRRLLALESGARGPFPDPCTANGGTRP